MNTKTNVKEINEVAFPVENGKVTMTVNGKKTCLLPDGGVVVMEDLQQKTIEQLASMYKDLNEKVYSNNAEKSL